MYMSEISKSKVSDLKAQKIIILWTLKHVSAIKKQPVYICILHLSTDITNLGRQNNAFKYLILSRQYA